MSLVSFDYFIKCEPSSGRKPSGRCKGTFIFLREPDDSGVIQNKLDTVDRQF